MWERAAFVANLLVANGRVSNAYIDDICDMNTLDQGWGAGQFWTVLIPVLAPVLVSDGFPVLVSHGSFPREIVCRSPSQIPDLGKQPAPGKLFRPKLLHFHLNLSSN